MAEAVELTGLSEFKAVLAEKTAALTAALVAAVAEEAEQFLSEARNAAPYRAGDDPEGHIREGFKMEHEGMTAVVSVENRHAAFQEYGTSHAAAQPFMHPTADASRARFPARVEAAAKKVAG